MQLTIKVPNEQLFDKIVWLLNSFKNQGLVITASDRNKNNIPTEVNSDGLDFSTFKIDSFKELDGLEYQKKIRDAW